MHISWKQWTAVAGVTLLMSLTAGLAAEPESTQLHNAYLQAGLGYSGVIRSSKVGFGVIEYRPDYYLWETKPWAGLYVSGRAYYFASGLCMDVFLTDHILLTPSFGVGIYSENDGIKLGSPLEFRSAIDLAYDMKSTGRIGVSFSHVSNGGITEINPGAELLAIFYAIPINL